MVAKGVLMTNRGWTQGLVAVALCVGLAACGQKSPEELLAAAKQAVAKDDLKAAQIHLKNALTQEPGNGEIRFMLGETLLNSGDPVGALLEFAKANEAQFDPNRVAPAEARAMLQTRKPREVLQQFATRQLTDPKAQAELQVVMAQAYNATNKPVEARAAVDEALRLVPKHPGATLVLARMAGAERRVDDALALVESVIQSAPTSGEAWRLKGDLLTLGKGDGKAGRAAFEKAVEVAPRDLAATQALIGHLVAVKDNDEAKKRIEVARKQFGDNTTVRYYAAYLAMGDGKLDEAKSHVEQLLKVTRDDPRVLFLAGQIAFQRGEDLVAESHLSKILNLPGDTGRVRLLLAATQLRMADPTKALRTLEPLLDDPGMRVSQVFAVAGDAHSQLGQTDKAQAMYARAAELDPNDARSRTMVALGRVAGGNEAQGLDQLRDLATQFESPVADVALIGSLIRKGDHAGALTALDALEKKTPGKADTTNMRAQVFLAQGATDKALAQWQESLKRDPKNMAAAVALARQDFATNRAADAVARFAAVAKADASNPVPQLAWLQARQLAGDKPEDLVKSAQQLVQQFPKVARVRTALVRVLQASGDTDRALSAAQEAVAALPNDGEVLELLGALQLARGDHGQAHKSMSDLVALRPRSPEALVRLAEVDIARKNYRQALGNARKALALKPDFLPALRHVMALELELGNPAAARKLVKEMQQEKSTQGLATVFEGDLEAKQGNWAAAAAAYQQGLAQKVQVPGLPSKAHRALLSAGKAAEAQAFAQKWIKDNPGDLLFVAYLADSALARSDWAEARSRYEFILKSSPNDVVVMNNLAWALLRTNQLKDAEALARKAVGLRPQAGAFLDTLSEILSAEGKHDEAIEKQRRAVELDGNNPARRVALAKRYIAANQKEKAKIELEAVAQLGPRYPDQTEVQALLKQL
jgi:putative PEP-CTERM system TPR-repeat lipoprotein